MCFNPAKDHCRQLHQIRPCLTSTQHTQPDVHVGPYAIPFTCLSLSRPLSLNARVEGFEPIALEFWRLCDSTNAHPHSPVFPGCHTLPCSRMSCQVLPP